MDEALERAKALRYYHTIELTPDYTTPGWFDLRGYVGEYGLPASMAGMRVLDVGTWDGFWAFEMERRGAEVVAIDLDDERDLDWPPRHRPDAYNVAGPRGQGFFAAREVLGSKVERVVKSVYFATPEELGQFDLVFCGSVLIHLRDQFLAIERIANLVKPGGMFISAEEHDRIADLMPWTMSRYRADRMKAVVYNMPSMRTWRQMMLDAGFDRVERHGRFTMVVGEGDKRFKVPHVVHHAFKNG
jgi:tRNA (mo5U34)-methyltransferase